MMNIHLKRKAMAMAKDIWKDWEYLHYITWKRFNRNYKINIYIYFIMKMAEFWMWKWKIKTEENANWKGGWVDEGWKTKLEEKEEKIKWWNVERCGFMLWYFPSKNEKFKKKIPVFQQKFFFSLRIRSGIFIWMTVYVHWIFHRSHKFILHKREIKNIQSVFAFSIFQQTDSCYASFYRFI